jgi:hypothetical protein
VRSTLDRYKTWFDSLVAIQDITKLRLRVFFLDSALGCFTVPLLF